MLLDKIIRCTCALCDGFGTRFESSGYDPRNTMERHRTAPNTVHSFFLEIGNWFSWQRMQRGNDDAEV